MNKIPLAKPYITEEVKAKVCEVLDSGDLTEGTVTRDFEDSIKSYVDCQYALAVCNCTVGLEMALRAMGVGPGDEVIVPDYTYPATAGVIQIVGARIVIVDIDPDTGLIDCDALEQAITSQTKAIIPVSIFGNPLDYGRLRRMREKHDFLILEDAACALGAKYDGVCVGNLADISVFSLHPRKFITTGEGGVVTTNNAQWAKWMDSFKHFGMSGHQRGGAIEFEQIGTNYKLSNIQAAVGLVQMASVQLLLDRRAEIAERYNALLGRMPGISLFKTTPRGIHSWQSYCIFVEDRDRIIQKLQEKGIETQIGTYSLHMQKAFKENPNCQIIGEMIGSRYAFKHCLTLPLYHDLKPADQEYVVEGLIEAMA